MPNDANISLNDKYLRLLGNPISVIAMMLAQMPFYFPGQWGYFWKATSIGVIFTGIMWEMGRQIILQGRRRYPSLHQTKKRILWVFFWVMVQYTIGQAAVTQVYFSTGLNVDKSLSFVETWLGYLGATIFFIVIIMGIYEAIYFFGQYKTAFQKAESLKKQQAQQRLDALKTRVNPHFLFNSLTTLSALIGEDAPKAEHFVDELSKVYRYLLRAGRQPVSSLGEELQFAESYAFLLKNRFEDGAFLFAQNLSSGSAASQNPNLLDSLLPSLSLQHCLDYFVRTQHLPLHIEVLALEKHLLVSGPNNPKALSFDASENDWQQLEATGAWTDAQDGRLKIRIPFNQKNTAA